MIDPVFRCAFCGALLTRKGIATLGCCNKCGMKRVTNVKFLSDTDKIELAQKGIDQAWLDEFSEVVPDGE